MLPGVRYVVSGAPAVQSSTAFVASSAVSAPDARPFRVLQDLVSMVLIWNSD